MKIALSLIAVLFVISGVYFYMSHQPAATPIEETPQAVVPTPTDTTSPAAVTSVSKNVAVTYNGTTFSPSSVSVRVGDTVTFTDAGTAPMWVASDPHPAHSGYSGTTKDQHCPDTAGTAFDQCSTGTTYTFTFMKAGTWGYHNHINHSAIGTVVVTQ